MATGVKVELLIGGVWTDITQYVMVRDDQGRISITRGIRDEGNQTEQASASMPLKNTDGRFSRRNAMGAWYGSIVRNQPVRISVPDTLGGTSYRVWGEVPKWAPSWDPTGTDVWVDIAANGILQRLAQGPASERSVLYNALASPPLSSLVAYWPIEDPTDATSITSALTSGSAMAISGTPTLASYDGFPASDPVADISSASLTGGVGTYGDPTAIQVRFLIHIPPAGLTNAKRLLSIDHVPSFVGDTAYWELSYITAGNTLVLDAYDGANQFLGVDLTHTVDVRGRAMMVSVELQESGPGITRAIRITDLNTLQTYSVSDSVGSSTLQRVTQVALGPASRGQNALPSASQGLPGCAVGHLTVENAITSMTALGVHLNPIGETAGRRIQRLCAENGIAYDSIGDLDDTAAMGGQGKTNTLSLIQECVTADGGLLYEHPTTLGLGYRTRASLHNQTPALTLDYTGFNLSEVPTPVEDDRYLANKVTVSVNGVTATYEETSGPLSTAASPAGVGVYGPNADSALALNLASSDEPTLLDQAAWRVHLGTVDEARYPQISVNLAHPSFTSNPALKQAVLALRMGDRVQVIHPPSWLGTDTIDQIVLGFEESISQFEHLITITCAPASPYSSIGYLDTAARIDTDGSQLAADATSATASLSVAITSGPLWITAADKLTVNPDFEIDTSNWTGSGAALARVATPQPAPFDGSWSLQLTPDGVSANAKAESAFAAVTVGSTYYAHAWVRCAVARTVNLNIDWYDAGNVFLSSTSLGVAVAAGTWTEITNSGAAPASATKAKVVPLMFGTPPASNVLLVDVALLSNNAQLPSAEFPFQVRAGGEVILVRAVSGASSPQTFTVIRSVNGVVKSHSAGEDVRLANPTILAL